MTDPNMIDFYRRAAGLQNAHAKGHRFEAAGALGRFHYHSGQTRRRSVLALSLFLLVLCCLLKGVIYQSIGAQSYDDRVAALHRGTVVQMAGAFLMQPEPVTRFIAEQIANGLTKLH